MLLLIGQSMLLRKVTRNHRIFPSDEAVYKVVYMAMRNIAKKWTMPIHNWKPALNRFAQDHLPALRTWVADR